jgi:fermentation-respiration switch protein FrsA (DUF1100 family)
MKRYFIFCLSVFIYYSTYCQKKIIDSAMVADWPSLRNQQISANGKYVLYSLKSHSGNIETWTVISADGLWNKDFKGLKNIVFSANGNHLVLQTIKDSLSVFDLESKAEKKLGFVNSYTVSKSSSLLGYWQKEQKLLALFNLNNSDTKYFIDVAAYRISDNGQALLVQEASTHLVKWYNIPSGNLAFSGDVDLNKIIFNRKTDQFAFYTKTNTGSSLNYFKAGFKEPITLVKNTSLELEECELIDGNIFFDNASEHLFFYCIQKIGLDKKAKNSTIWKYWEASPVVYGEEPESKSSLFVVSLNANLPKIIRLQREDDESIIVDAYKQNFACTYNQGAIGPGLKKAYLISCLNGSRDSIDTELFNPVFSNTGKYIIWYNSDKHNWFSYNTVTKLKRNITANIKVSLENSRNVRGNPIGEGVLGWSPDDASVYIYDKYDIWKADPECKKLPVNITLGWGRKHNIELRFLFNSSSSGGPRKDIRESDTLLLSGFNSNTKEQGMFKLALSGTNRLEKLYMGREGYCIIRNLFPSICGQKSSPMPSKAANTLSYLVMKMKANEYPALCITKDFKTFKQLTNLSPQSGCNWMTNELIHFKVGKRTESAILYKPENFDPIKKYPVIFYYYEKNSDGIDLFVEPVFSQGQLPVAWFVSRGYLVFVPDFSYKKGAIGKTILQTVNAAADYLSNFSWVNSKKIGLQGHSFGGFETNYIITHTNRFVAASSCAGVSDLISLYNTPRGDGFNNFNQGYCEKGQGRMFSTPWQDLNYYINESPVLKADFVKTPLLIMHNEDDTSVPFSQGLEFFLGLQRLNKKVIMLLYKDEGHVLLKSQNQYEYTVKLTQFFDYYLKNTPAPAWMTP